MSAGVTTAATVLADAMTEAEWQHCVEAWARDTSWLVYHTWSSRNSEAGFPDLVLARAGDARDPGEYGPVGQNQLVVFELKTTTGKVTEAQQRWLDLFAGVPGVIARVVRPSDEAEVLRILTGGRT